MPTYPFKCDGCQHEFDIFQKMSADRENIVCPECQSHATQTFKGCNPLVMMHMQVGGNSGFAKADMAHEKIVKQLERESYERYHAPTQNPVIEKDSFWESLTKFDEHKPSAAPDFSKATAALERVSAKPEKVTLDVPSTA